VLCGLHAQVRGQLTSLERATCGSLVVIDVHARDVVDDMTARGVNDIRDFNWCVALSNLTRPSGTFCLSLRVGSR